MRDEIDDCVHCGFCLPACPTYVSWSKEADSPRGRIYLMKGLRDGALTWDGAVALHFDRCLGCMACVSACPSGVRYDALIERARAARERNAPRTLADALFRDLLFAFLPYPRRLRLLAVLFWVYARSGLRALVRRTGLLARLSPRLAQLEALAPERTLHEIFGGAPAGSGSSRASPARALPPSANAAAVAEGEARARVAVLTGCVQSVFFPGVNAATLRVLSREGCEAVVPEGQGCCGALSLHAGRDAEARRFARGVIRAFEDAEVSVVLVNAAGCGSAMKEYGRLFAGDRDWAERARLFAAKVRDVSEFLAELVPRARRHAIEGTVAYHDACHLAHAQRVRAQPRRLLAAIPGLSVREVPDGDQCCGSAGIYNLVEPGSANEIGARKVESVLRTGARVLVSANPGCTLHLQRLLRERGETLSALHPIELLDRSLRGEPLEQEDPE